MKKIAIFAAVGLAVFCWLRYRPFRVEVQGNSMSPALRDGDWVVAVRSARSAGGHVVVLEHPDRPGFAMVKRITGTAEGVRVFVEGDNAGESTDSRTFGPVDESTLKGRVVLVYSPRLAFVSGHI